MSWFIKTEQFKSSTSKINSDQISLHIKDHIEWANTLINAGEIIISGYLIDEFKKPGGGGFLILQKDSYNQAINLILNDPMIKNNLVDWKLNEYIVCTKNSMKII